ncbi:MAG: type II toxin-antitoxin system Phd/YefM family antitoxin [Gammaproteobacteria bacterium]|nr:type II toxin-antitoxin system Phd/YefM family antitoxin [Gammaproteobacteria bacterium]
MNEVLNALAKRERVEILYHGRVKGIIVPAGQGAGVKASEHPLFSMSSDETGTVEEVVDHLRGGRCRDI